MSKVFLFVEVNVKPGKMDEFINKVKAHGAVIRTEAGCEFLEVYRNTQKEDVLNVWEIWSDRKGAWDTFDADGYVNLLARIKGQKDLVIHAPDFDRDIDESIGSAIPIYPTTSLVIAEGTFLLSQQGNWPQVLPLLDQSWFVQLEDESRHERLIKRHNKHGMSIEEAKSWTLNTDEKNAQMVKADHARATLSFKVI